MPVTNVTRFLPLNGNWHKNISWRRNSSQILMLRSQYKTNNLVQYLCSDPGSGREVNTCCTLPGCTKCPLCIFSCQLLYRNTQAESQKPQNNMPRAELASLQSHGKKVSEFTANTVKLQGTSERPKPRSAGILINPSLLRLAKFFSSSGKAHKNL